MADIAQSDPDVCTTRCPCGSGLLTIDCCFAARGLFVPPAWTAPKTLVQTFYANSGCYAAPLQNCTDKLSREPYLSAEVLSRLNENRISQVRGLPWLNGQTLDTLSPAALAVPLLCERHQPALRGLDDIALRFLDALDSAVETCFDAEPKPSGKSLVFNGHDIERWLLKVLCGLLHSGRVVVGGQAITGSPNPGWLGVLFQGEPFPPHCGLCFKGQAGDALTLQKSLGLVPIVGALSPNQPPTLMGLALVVHGLVFLLHLAPVPLSAYPEGNLFHGCVFRPSSLTVHTATRASRLVFGWDTPEERQHVRIR